MKLDATHLPQQQQQHPQSHQSSPQQQHQQTQQSQQSKQGPSAALSSQQPQKQQKQKQQQSKEAQQPQPSQQQQQQQLQQQSKQAQQPQPSQQQQEQLQHQQQSQQAQQPQPSQQQPPHIQLQSQQSLATSIENEKELLHGYIYDYLIKQKLFDSAKVFHKEAEVAVQSTSTAIIAGASTTSDTQTGNNSNPSGPNGSVGPDSGISSVVSIGSVSPNNSKASANNASSGNGDKSSSSNSGAKKLSQSNDDNSKENLSSNDPSTTSDQKTHVNGVGSSSNSSTPRLNSAQDKKNANAPNTRDNINADIPKDLPLSSVQVDTPQGFLLEWWSIFWDLYNAKGMKSGSTNAQQFLQNSLRLRQEQTRMLQLQQQQQQQQTHHLQQQQQSHQLPHQMHQPGQQQQSQFPQQVTVQQLQQQPGMISQANGGMNIVAPNGQIVNYPGFINAQQANLINAGLMHNTAAASQIPDNMSDADKRNLAARQAFFRRNMSTGGLPVNQAQFQQQLFQQQQQQRMQQAQQQAQQQQQQQKQAKQPLQQPQPPHQQLQQQGQSQQPLQQPQSQQGPNQTPQQKPQPSGPPGQPAISRQPVQPGQTQPAGPGQPVPASPQIQQQAQQTPQTQPVQHQLPQQQQQQPHQLPQQGQPIRVQQNPNHQNVRPAGQVSQHQTPQPTPQFAHAQPHASNQASPASHPQGFVSQSQAVSHRNSPAIEGENLNSPSTQGGSPAKRQRLSPEGTYAAAGAAMNGQMMQNMAGQPVMISNGMQFSPQFNGGMVQMKVGMNGMPQQFPVGMMTPQQRQNLINMGKIPGQPMMGPGVVQMPGGAVTVDAQGMIVDEYGRVTGNRVPQNMAALQDYQNQLMLLERVNQQRLNDGSNGIVQPGMMNPQQALAAGGINPNQQALAAGGINPNQQVQFQKQTRSGSVASPGVPNADIPRKGQPQTPTQGPMRTSPAGNGFNGNLVQGPNGMMMAPPMQGGAHGIWTGQPNQAQSPHIQQRQSPSQGMNGPQLPPGHSPAMAHQSMNGGMGQPPNQMPPPNGPIPVIGNKTQPSSPSPANNPPTPKTAAKQIGKGNKKTDSPKRRNKKAPATPVGVSEPPTPTPTTPATPHTANASLPPTTTSAPNPASVMASAHTPNSSGSKASGNEKEKVDIEMNDAGPFNAGNPAMQINAQPMMMATGPEGMDTQMMVANNGPVLDGSVFLEDFAGNENDMDFDINTFLNEDGTSGSLGFEGSTGFWPE